jgi:hypothetical protein
LFRFASPSSTQTTQREGYTVAEKIMRSAARTKRGEQRDRAPRGERYGYPAH